MREDDYEIQTPKKELLWISSNRKPKSIGLESKKLNHPQQKISKISFSSLITENDAVLDLSEKESSQISSISASVDDDQSYVEHTEVLDGISSEQDAFVSDEDQSSESREIVRKSLGSVFTPTTENDVVSDQSTMEISKLSLISDHSQVSDNSVSLQHPEVSLGSSSLLDAFVSDENQCSESIQSYIRPLNQFISPSSVKSRLVKRCPLSSTKTVEMTPFSSPIEEVNAFKRESFVKHLRESMFQVLHSADIEPKHKMFLDELSTLLIKESYGLKGHGC